MITLLKTRPWILIVLAFVVLISSWIVLLNIAARNQPEKIPLPPAPADVSR